MLLVLGFPQGRVPGLRGQNVKQRTHRAEGDGGIAGGPGTKQFTVRRIWVSGLQQIVHSLRYLFVSFDLAAFLELNIEGHLVGRNQNSHLRHLHR